MFNASYERTTDIENIEIFLPLKIDISTLTSQGTSFMPFTENNYEMAQCLLNFKLEKRSLLTDNIYTKIVIFNCNSSSSVDIFLAFLRMWRWEIRY